MKYAKVAAKIRTVKIQWDPLNVIATKARLSALFSTISRRKIADSWFIKSVDNLEKASEKMNGKSVKISMNVKLVIFVL